MSNYKRYISMAVSVILLPLAKLSLVKIINTLTEKSEQDPYVEENDAQTSSHTNQT